MKRLTIFIVLALCVHSAVAQFHYGIKGGADLVTMALDWPGITNEQVRLSYHVGLYGIHYASERVSFSPELLYTSKGFQAEAPSVTAGGSPDAFTMHLHYLSLPLLAGYSLTERFLVRLGPEIGYLIAARSRFGLESNDASALWDERMDIGIVADVSYFISERINMGVRYVYGLRDVAPNNFGWTDPQDPLRDTFDFRSQNRVLQLSAGYRLR